MHYRFSLVVAGLFLILSPHLPGRMSKTDAYALFEQPGKMVRLPTQNRLSLYCEGRGQPTVVLESGFGGGTWHEWHLLQPLLARDTRVCSYDRAGYGFSELGNDLPRDIKHEVMD